MGSDLRAALRMPRRNPAWAAAIILTFAIGIGANTAVFSLVEAMVLRPLPFTDPHELFFVDAVVGTEPGHLSKREYRELIKSAQAVEDYAGYYPSQYNIVDPPTALVATIGTSNLFPLLGARMIHGAPWDTAADFQRTYDVVLTHRLWQQRFGGRTDIVGRTIVMDGGTYRVSGVLGEGFDYPIHTDIYRSITDYDGDQVRRLWVIGRMRDGRTMADVQGELDRMSTHFERLYPDTNRAVRLRARPLSDLYLGAAKPYLLLLPAAVALLLVIACANVANLLLSRALSRGGEIAVRMAVGANWRDLARLSMLEAVVLAVPGALLGVLLSHWSLQALMAMVRTDLPAWFDVRIDFATLLFTLVTTTVTAVAVGLAPALHARRVSLEQTLRLESGRNVGPKGSRWWRASLVGAQAALAAVLLISATVFMLGVRNLQRTDVGFDPDGLSTFRTDPPYSRYATIPQVSVFYRQAIDRLKERPGVIDAASNQRIPFAALDAASPRVAIEGRSAADAEAQPFVNFQVISPGYFDVMRIPVLSGRRFTEFDAADNPLVAIVSAKAAKRFWGDDDPIGRRISMAWNQDGTSRAGGAPIMLTVVGVAGNVRADGLQQDPGLDVYAPYTQTFAGDSFFVVRTSLAPDAIATEIPRAIAAVDPEQSHFGVMSMRDRVAASMWQQQVSGTILAVFAVVAFVLATLGVHAVTSYSVEMTRAELGIRLALGAERATVIRSTVRQALLPVGTGLIAGTVIGAFGAALVAQRLPVDAVLTGTASIVPPLLLLIVAAVAATLPTARIVNRTDLPSVLR
jgi:putative ABC transport system permease protein